MKYKVELSSVRNFPAWSGGKDTLDEVVERGAEDLLTELIEMVFAVACQEMWKSTIFFGLKKTIFIVS